MTGQMTIMEWLRQKETQEAEKVRDIPERKSLGDADIDAIVAQLDRIAQAYKIKTMEARLTTWAHVPKMGRRLTYTWIITREHLDNRRIAAGGRSGRRLCGRAQDRLRADGRISVLFQKRNRGESAVLLTL